LTTFIRCDILTPSVLFVDGTFPGVFFVSGTMERTDIFHDWLKQLLIDAKKKAEVGGLDMTDEAVAYILFQEATAHYLHVTNKIGELKRETEELKRQLNEKA